MIDLDPTFAAALRAELVARAAAARTRRVRRPLVVTSFAIAGLTVAGGAAAAVTAVLPGGTVTTDLAAPVVEQHVGSATVHAGQRPAGATGVRIEITCESTGLLTFADGASATCEPHDPASSSTWDTSYVLPVPAGQDGTTITGSAGTRWTSTVVWVDERVTDLATNSAGDTYGVDGPGGHPDLIAVIATNGLTGYAYATDLDGGPMPTSPAQALELQAENAGKVVTVPVYEADGKTVIGEFQMGP